MQPHGPRFAHELGSLQFESTPRDFSIRTVADQTVELMGASSHCVVKGDECADADSFRIFSRAPSTRYVLYGEETHRIPADVDLSDKAAVRAWFFSPGLKSAPVRDDEEEKEARLFQKNYHEHLSPLVDLHHAMYTEHQIVGRDHPSAMPLYQMALSIANADERARLDRVHGRVSE